MFASFFVFSSFIGFTVPEGTLIKATDVILFLMSILCILALIKNSERIITLSEENGLLKKSDSGKKRVPR